MLIYAEKKDNSNETGGITISIYIEAQAEESEAQYNKSSSVNEQNKIVTLKKNLNGCSQENNK